MMDMDSVITQAVAVYRNRQSRLEHPAGKFDRGGRWYPSDAERQPCCCSVRSPSRSWPYSLITHCRTAIHIAALHNIDAAELRRAARQGGVR